MTCVEKTLARMRSSLRVKLFYCRLLSLYFIKIEVTVKAFMKHLHKALKYLHDNVSPLS